MSYPFTAPQNISTDSVLVCVPVDYIPFFRTFFEQMQRRQTWRSHADYAAAYQVFAQIEVNMVSGCIADLIAEVRALRGLKPDFAAVDPLARTTDMYFSLGDLLIGQLDTRGVLDGTTDYATLSNIVQALVLITNPPQLDEILMALRGADPVVDNILEALRGTTPADETRNIVELLT